MDETYAAYLQRHQEALDRAEPLAISLIGTSGVGKSFLSQKLSHSKTWYRYSIDYRIADFYLKENIHDALNADLELALDQAQAEDRSVINPQLDQLIRQHAVTLAPKLSLKAHPALSWFVGMFGDPNRGGYPYELFWQRQQLYSHAEAQALYDLERFVKKAHQRKLHMVADTSGSICEIVATSDSAPPTAEQTRLLQNDSLFRYVCKHTLLVYLLPKAEAVLTERQLIKPKPMLYQKSFFDQSLRAFHQTVNSDALPDPSDFIRFLFSRLLRIRHKRYLQMVQIGGCVVPAQDACECDSPQAFVALIQDAMQHRQDVIMQEITRAAATSSDHHAH